MWLIPLKKSLIKIIKIIGIIFTVLYPFIVFFALKKQVAVRIFALLLLAVGGWNFVQNKNKYMFGCVLLLCGCIAFFNQDIFVKLYPVLMNFAMCAIFALSLSRTPLIEQFAKRMGYTLNDKKQLYARHATIAWAIFMGIIGIFSLITVFLSDEIWVLYNGLISYILIALMFGIEFVIRKRCE